MRARSGVLQSSLLGFVLACVSLPLQAFAQCSTEYVPPPPQPFFCGTSGPESVRECYRQAELVYKQQEAAYRAEWERRRLECEVRAREEEATRAEHARRAAEDEARAAEAAEQRRRAAKAELEIEQQKAERARIAFERQRLERENARSPERAPRSEPAQSQVDSSTQPAGATSVTPETVLAFGALARARRGRSARL